MAFVHLSDRRIRRGFPGSLAVASCSGRLVPQSAKALIPLDPGNVGHPSPAQPPMPQDAFCMDTFDAINQRRSVKAFDPEHRLTAAEETKLLEEDWFA
jgi:hypothetical protein